MLSWMMDDFIHWSKPYLLLSKTCDEILPWIIKNWMQIHMVTDNKCHIVNLYLCATPILLHRLHHITFGPKYNLKMIRYLY